MSPAAVKGLSAGVGIGAVVIGIVMLASPSRRSASEPAPAPAAAVDEQPAAEPAPTPAELATAAATKVEIYKTPACGCCGGWVRYMQARGFNVVVHDVSNDELDRVNAANGVPQPLESCHTSLVKGYAVVGHVPASDLLRMLEQRPKIAGLTVPGMVQGPPGMESGTPQPYRVLAFTTNGQTSVYASH